MEVKEGFLTEVTFKLKFEQCIEVGLAKEWQVFVILNPNEMFSIPNQNLLFFMPQTLF